MTTITAVNWPRVPSLFIVAGALWLLSAPLLGHMGRPWPCVVAGAVLGVCALMLYFKPSQRRGWGALAVMISVGTMLLGSGAIIPALLGAVGGVTGVVWSRAQNAE